MSRPSAFDQEGGAILRLRGLVVSTEGSPHFRRRIKLVVMSYDKPGPDGIKLRINMQ